MSNKIYIEPNWFDYNNRRTAVMNPLKEKTPNVIIKLTNILKIKKGFKNILKTWLH